MYKYFVLVNALYVIQQQVIFIHIDSKVELTKTIEPEETCIYLIQSVAIDIKF